VKAAHRHIWGLGSLVLAVLVTGLALIHSAQQSRLVTSEIRMLQQMEEELQVEWLQMQLEQSAVTAKFIVDQVARERLHMTTPEPAETIYLRP